MAITNPFSRRSLSTKLLLLTAVFVLFAEILLMIPSIARQRVIWFEMRIEEAYLVSLALEAPRQVMVDEKTIRQLFATANILGVTINEGNARRLILAPELDPHGSTDMYLVDLNRHRLHDMIGNAWGTIFSRGEKLIQVTGSPRFVRDEQVNIVVSQQALRNDLLIYASKILGLSLIISSLTAVLVYWSLNRMIVRPVKRVTQNIMTFQADPEQSDRILKPSNRADEIGIAEQSLAEMQRSIYNLLNEHRRLAALGAGISKISHDLRNILASAQLMSDRLARSDDPRVRKLSPRLISALDRAINLSRDTLTFGRMEASILQKESIDLHHLAQEVLDDTAALGVEAENRIPESFKIVADRTHLYRAIFNIVRNAVEAMAPELDNAASNGAPPPISGSVWIAARQSLRQIIIEIGDTGPGIPDHARPYLFEPFKGSQKPGGSGLGVAISAEIARAHGGSIVLAKNDETGATFQLTLPLASDQSLALTAPVNQTPSRLGSTPPS